MRYHSGEKISFSRDDEMHQGIVDVHQPVSGFVIVRDDETGFLVAVRESSVLSEV